MNGPLVILGATGAIGTGVVAAAVQAHRTIIAVARDPARLDALRDRHPGADITLLPGCVSDEASGAALAMRLQALQLPVTDVVASLKGTAMRGRLLDQPVSVLQRGLDEYLVAHLVAARCLVPLLAEAGRGGSYVMVGGPGSQCAWAGYGHGSVCAAGLRMLAQVLHDEARSLSVRLQMLAIDTPVRTVANRMHACTQWPSARAVGQSVLALIDRSASAQPIVALADIPAETGISAGVPSRHERSGKSADSASREPPPSRQGPLLTPRCQSDAGTLLASILSSKPNQESPTR